MHAEDVGLRVVAPRTGDDGLVALRRFLGALDADEHAARFGLVQDLGRDDLEDHREAHRGGELRRLGARGGDAFGRHGDAVGVAEELAFRRGEGAAALGAHLVEDFPDDRRVAAFHGFSYRRTDLRSRPIS